MNRPLAATLAEGRITLLLAVIRELGVPGLIPRTQRAVGLTRGDLSQSGEPCLQGLQYLKTGVGVGARVVRLIELHTVVGTQVGQFTPALTPLVEATIEYENVDYWTDASTL